MVMNILTAPHPVLLQKAHPISRVDKRVEKLIKNMIETLLAQKDPIGVGLSANQVGVLDRIFLARPDEQSESVDVFINPEVLAVEQGGADREPTLEGCLSIPRIWGKVLRPQKAHVSYMDLSGTTSQKWFDGFEAVVVQHELDHLNGILFTQRVLEQGGELFKEVDGELQPYRL